jgi:ABC-type transporter MlaC component
MRKAEAASNQVIETVSRRCDNLKDSQAGIKNWKQKKARQTENAAFKKDLNCNGMCRIRLGSTI